MGVIETEEAAKRLARVIVSDIEIYNREKFQSGADLTAAIEEGRALFRSRVAPALFPLFTTVLEDRRVARSQKAAASAAAETAPAEKSGSAAVASPPPRAVEAAPVPTPAWASGGSASTAPASPRPTPPPSRVPVEPVIQAALSASAPSPVLSAPVLPPATLATSEEAMAPAPVIAVPAAPESVVIAAPVARSAAPGRAGAITTEEAAARLARVIVSDIQLYNAKKIAARQDLSREIDEGRSLFKTRVSEELLSIFETTLAGKGLDNRGRMSAVEAPAAVAAPPTVAAPVAAPEAAAPKPKAPIPAAETPLPATPAPQKRVVPATIGRAPFPAVKAPGAPSPRPGASIVRRPTPAPHPGMAAFSDGGAVGLAQAGQAGQSRSDYAAAQVASSGHATSDYALPVRVPAYDGHETPALVTDSASDELTPAVNLESTPPPRTPTPPPRTPTPPPRLSRPTGTPPPTPATGRYTPATMAVVPPAPRATRPPSVPEIPITEDVAGFADEEPRANASLPPQEVLDALPSETSLPPIPRRLTPAAFPPASAPEPAASAPRAPTPVPLPAAAAQVTAPPAPPSLAVQFAPSPGAVAGADQSPNNEVVSLRKTMSKTRLVVTIAVVSAVVAAIYYAFAFLL